MNIENIKAQMRKGVLEMVVLSIIGEKEVYPSDIITSLKEKELIVVEGTIYPLLTRLKNAELLNYQWRESKSGPPRKYYSRTKAGESFLKKLESNWNHLSGAINKSLTTENSIDK